jgi:hypothetical protein
LLFAQPLAFGLLYFFGLLRCLPLGRQAGLDASDESGCISNHEFTLFRAQPPAVKACDGSTVLDGLLVAGKVPKASRTDDPDGTGLVSDHVDSLSYRPAAARRLANKLARFLNACHKQ